jgi:mono/diheme cytochrome c family protein
MRRKIVSIGIVVAVAASLGLSACSDSDPEAADTPATAETIVNSATQTDANGETVPAEVESAASEVVSEEEAGGDTTGVGDIAAGEVFFAATCSGCHLDNGKSAGGVGPQLAGNPNITGQEYVIGVVTNGKGAMPAGLASGTDLDNVSAYVVSLQ